ncbi:MAG: divergent polysaccharide deacetylase family protein [Halopseudomonas sp.]|uniref:divergent polysaccharide deacetylase family protein n=1 Tax=Halopseudomonas sp. TaxID=2901191 RepID=UPI0030018AAD
MSILLAAVLLSGCSDESPDSAAATKADSSTQLAAEVAVEREPVAPAILSPGVGSIPSLPPPAPESAAGMSPDASSASAPPPELATPPVAPGPAEVQLPAPSPTKMAPPAALPMLSIIIDDVGHSRAAGERIIALPAPVALAIMPFTRNAQALATLAAEAGKPVMLHLPMENLAGLSMGEGGLSTQMSRTVFDAQLQASLNAFTPIQGVNNHMGSKLTADRERMDWLMTQLAARQLFFVDSRTNKETQAAFAAQASGVANVSRDVFLDNLRTPVELEREFKLVLARARKQGAAVLIGHPYPETLAFLEQQLPGLEAREGVQLVSVQALLTRPH